MTIQLLTVLSAAALAATGLGATSETRSAQSLPAQNLVLAPISGASGKFHTVSRLVDAAPTDQSDESKCSKDGGYWDDKKLKCRRGAWWWQGSGVRLLIGAGTIAGIVVAVSDSGNGSGNNSVSN